MVNVLPGKPCVASKNSFVDAAEQTGILYMHLYNSIYIFCKYIFIDCYGDNRIIFNLVDKSPWILQIMIFYSEGISMSENELQNLSEVLT